MKPRIERIARLDEEAWRPLVARYPLKPYYFVERLADEKRTASLLDSLREASWRWGAFAGDEPRAICWAEPCPWESEHFGFGFAKLCGLIAAGDDDEQLGLESALLGKLVEHCRAEQFHVVHACVETRDLTAQWALDEQGFRFALTSVVWIGRVERLKAETRPRCAIRDAEPSDLPALRRLSVEGMAYNRFHAEPRFPRERVAALYAEMADACLSGKLADHVLVATSRGRPCGFVALKLRRPPGLGLRIGQIRYLVRTARPGSLAEAAAGANLIEAGIRWFRNRVDYVEAGTAAQNTSAIRFALTTGLRIESTTNDYFRWLE